MQRVLLPGLIWKDAWDSVHQPSAFLTVTISFSPLHHFFFSSLPFSPLFSLYIYSPLHSSLVVIPFWTIRHFSHPPFVSHFLLCQPICQENISFGLFLSILLFLSVCVRVCARACMPRYKSLTDQKQACISGGQCVPWPHPHSALGYSAWAW